MHPQNLPGGRLDLAAALALVHQGQCVVGMIAEDD